MPFREALVDTLQYGLVHGNAHPLDWLAMPWIFSYGTLQVPEVQRQTFGRLPRSVADVLPGFELCKVPIRDSALALSLGTSHHRNVVANPDVGRGVVGLALEISDGELMGVDAYEAQYDYRRLAVVLDSGREAWVYRNQPSRGARSRR